MSLLNNVKEALLVLGFIIATVIMAAGAEWKFLGKDGRSNDYYIDSSSIKEIKSGIIRARVKFVPSSGSPLKHFKDKIVNYSTELKEYDCSGRRIRRLVVTIHFDDGTNETGSFENARWEPILHKTFDENIYEFVCKI